MANRRMVRKEIQLSAAEYARIRRRAEACGMSPAVYIRETALGAVPKARPNRLGQEVIYRLTRIGARLNHVARGANDNDGLHAAMDLDALSEEIAALILSLGEVQSPEEGEEGGSRADDRKGRPGS